VPVGVTLRRLSDCSFVEFNDAAARNLGYTREEFARLTIRDLLVPAEPDKKTTADAGCPAAYETRMRAKNGQLRDLIIATYPLEIGGETVICGISQDITERKRVEDLLRQQLYIIEAITSTAADGVFMTDGDRRLTFMNPAAERMFGFGFDEFRGQSLHTMIHHSRPDGSPYPASECPMSAVFTTSTTLHDHRDVCFRKGGTPVYVSVSNAPLIRGGKIVAMVVIIRDVTEAELAGRKLAETNERLESALATAALGVWSVNFETGEVKWDDRMNALAGRAPGEPVTMAEALSDIHPDDRHQIETMLQMPVESGRDIQWEWRVTPRGGGVRWHQSRGHVIRDESGKVVATRGVTRDITDLKRAQEVREHFAAIVESSEDSISSATLEGIIVSWNRGAQAIFGYAPAEVVGKSAAILIPSERSGEMPMFLARIARGEATEHYQTERLTKDGRRIVVSITLSPVRNDAGQVVGVSTITRDITREKLLEEKLRQAEKMEAIGQLAGGIAHDFNNLLTIINGYAAMGLIVAADELLREQLAAIQAAGLRATALTGQLLAFSRKQMLHQVQVVSINAVVEAMHPLLRRVIREDIECVMELDPALSNVKADPHQLEEVLLNLVINAGDAMPSGGRILIETKNAVLDDQYVLEHPDAVAGNYAMLAVSDSGAGIDPGIRARIFEPFFTTKPVGKGTGLGLSMVYGITRQSGGHVTCHSETGMGATFRVYLPASEGGESRPYSARDPEPESVRGTETILLVEDDAALRTYAAKVLRDLGYSVHEASDGKEAVVLGEKNRETIDLLITDMVMPGLSGLDLAAVMAPPGTRMKVLYVSGYTDHAIVQKGILEPGLEFLGKPYSPGQLARKVRELLAG
jgi:PAS domain S-box-containing protein